MVVVPRAQPSRSDPARAKREWPLLPSALRDGAAAPLLLQAPENQWIRRAADNTMKQHLAELVSIQRFVWEADSQGLSLPNESQRLRRQLANFDMTVDEDAEEIAPGLKIVLWPPEVLLPTLALAQHATAFPHGCWIGRESPS